MPSLIQWIKDNQRTKSIKSVFTLNFLLFLLVIMLSFIPLVSWGVNVSIKKERQEISSRAEEMLAEVGSEISSVQQSALIMKDAILQQASYKPNFRPAEIYGMHSQQEKLATLNFNLNYIKDIAILYRNGMLVTSRYTYPSAPDILPGNDLLSPDNPIKDDAILERMNRYLREGSYGSVPLTLREQLPDATSGSGLTPEPPDAGDALPELPQYLEFVIPVLGVDSRCLASIVTFIDFPAFNEQLESYGIEDYWIFRRRGELIYSHGDPALLGGLDLLSGETPPVLKNTAGGSRDLIQLENPQLDWVLYINPPHANANLTSPMWQHRLILYMAMILVLGIILSFKISSWHSQSIKEVYEDLQAKGNLPVPGDPLHGEPLSYNNFRTLALQLSDTMHQYRISNEELNEALHYEYFNRLLRGQEHTWSDSMDEDFLERICFPSFRLAMLFVIPQKPVPALEGAERAILMERFRAIYNRPLYLHKLQTSLYVVILPTDLEDDDTQEHMEKLVQAMESEPYRLTIAVSQPCLTPDDIGPAYSAIQHALDQAAAAGQDFLILEEEKSTGVGGITTSELFELRSRLIAERLDVTDYIQELWQRNLPAHQQELVPIYYAIRNVLDNVYRTMDDEPHWRSRYTYREFTSPDEALDFLLNYAVDVVDKAKQYHSEAGSPIIHLIAQYIDNNYMDPELNGAGLAELFNISEKYFYTLFKEIKGITYAKYLENLRIGEATRLLKSSDMKIKNIAQAVGYNSADTFSKAFKRVLGTSPGGYRELYLDFDENDTEHPDSPAASDQDDSQGD